jgi:hypothetical protein
VVSPVKHSTNVPYSSPDERHHWILNVGSTIFQQH